MRGHGLVLGVAAMGVVTLSIASQPSFGTVMLINNGTAIRYTPNGAVRNETFCRRGLSNSTISSGSRRRSEGCR